MLKQVRDDIKSLINQIKKTDLRDQVAFNELCYGRRVGDRIYAFCPFCRKVVEIDAGLTEPQGGRLRLQETASCGCRQGLRYIQLGFLERMQPRKKDQKHPFDDIRFQIRIKGDLYKRTLRSQLAQEQRKQEQKQKQQTPDERSWEVGLHGAAYDGSDYGTDDFGYIPDDFEPGMDPYDRQAVYDDQLVDDWVIASGGNPADYGDWSDAFTDPFGFHDDFGGGDGGFGGFGGWGGGGFGGGDD